MNEPNIVVEWGDSLDSKGDRERASAMKSLVILMQEFEQLGAKRVQVSFED